MTSIELHIPRIQDILGERIYEFPNGWDWPYTVLVREAWLQHGEKLAKGAQMNFTVPKYGTLTMQGRSFKLEFDKAYAAKKGYAATMEGTWG